MLLILKCYNISPHFQLILCLVFFFNTLYFWIKKAFFFFFFFPTSCTEVPKPHVCPSYGYFREDNMHKRGAVVSQCNTMTAWKRFCQLAYKLFNHQKRSTLQKWNEKEFTNQVLKGKKVLLIPELCQNVRMRGLLAGIGRKTFLVGFFLDALSQFISLT